MDRSKESMESKPRFATILAARGNDGRPSDLEFMIRSHCQKLRVVEKLSGAHLLIPSESSLAVRAYFPCDLEDHSVASGDCKSDDFDNLHAFLNSFKLALVLFILPFDKQREQLDNPSSFLHRAQRLVRSVTISADANADKTIRVFLLSDTESAITTLTSVSNAMKKRDLKHAYFEKQRETHFLPQSTSIPLTSAPAAATHVAEAFRNWAERFDLPPGEANVLMSLLGTLGDIITADDVLESVPIDDRTKRLLRVFFGSEGNIQPATTTAVTPTPHHVSPPPPYRANYLPQMVVPRMETTYYTPQPTSPPYVAVAQKAYNPSVSSVPYPSQQVVYPPRNPYAARTPAVDLSSTHHHVGTENTFMPTSSQAHSSTMARRYM